MKAHDLDIERTYQYSVFTFDRSGMHFLIYYIVSPPPIDEFMLFFWIYVEFEWSLYEKKTECSRSVFPHFQDTLKMYGSYTLYLYLSYMS